MQLAKLLMLITLVGALTFSSRAAQTTLTAVADTTISIGAINAGSSSGSEIVAGSSGLGGTARALIRFDLSTLPGNAIIDSATVRVTITKQANPLDAPPPEPTLFALHRVTRSWSEAQASWIEASSGTLWATAGGDVDPEPSADVVGGGVGNVLQFTSADLVTNVQSWVSGSAVNSGWLLRVVSEAEEYSARRFASRESSSGPQLVVNYHTNAPVTAVTILNPRLNAGRLDFDFQAATSTAYAVEFLNEIGATWQPLTNITVTSASLATVSDVRTNAQRFYRVTASATP